MEIFVLSGRKMQFLLLLIFLQDPIYSQLKQLIFLHQVPSLPQLDLGKLLILLDLLKHSRYQLFLLILLNVL
jgi:hypothetical protein